MKNIHVVAAIIKQQDKILAAKRNYGTLKGFWEFPGGKVQAGEQPEKALQREIKEEMNASLQIEQYFTTIEYDYPDFHMIMDCYICTADNIELNKNVHDELKWLNLQNLDSVDWLPADETIVNRLKIYLSSTILVSDCLLGDNCKYNGGNNFNQHVCDLIKGKRIIKICPEILAGLPLPRKPVEISGGRIITSDNEDMTQLYRESALKALQNITNEPIDLALLKANSPTCGNKYIYDGTFSHKLVAGSGIFAKMLQDRNIPVLSELDI